MTLRMVVDDTNISSPIPNRQRTYTAPSSCSGGFTKNLIGFDPLAGGGGGVSSLSTNVSPVTTTAVVGSIGGGGNNVVPQTCPTQGHHHLHNNNNHLLLASLPFPPLDTNSSHHSSNNNNNSNNDNTTMVDNSSHHSTNNNTTATTTTMNMDLLDLLEAQESATPLPLINSKKQKNRKQPKHRKGAQSFCTSDLRDIWSSTGAATSSSSSNHDSKKDNKGDGTSNTLPPTVEDIFAATGDGGGGAMDDFLLSFAAQQQQQDVPPPPPATTKTSPPPPAQQQEQQQVEAEATPQTKRRSMLGWAKKKSHRRIQSMMDPREMASTVSLSSPPSATTTDSSKKTLSTKVQPSSLPTTPILMDSSGGGGMTMDDDMLQGLMDTLSLQNPIPNLSSNHPTTTVPQQQQVGSKDVVAVVPVTNKKTKVKATTTPPRTPPRPGKRPVLSFLTNSVKGKNHRRTKSMMDPRELSDAAAVAAAAAAASSLAIPSMSNHNNSDHNNNNNISIGGEHQQQRSSMYPDMIQDLMEIRDSFDGTTTTTTATDTNSNNAIMATTKNNAINPLAKPSPTSFLMGKCDEIVRTSELDPSPHQMDIPNLSEFLLVLKLIDFVNVYRTIDQNLDLNDWVGKTRMDLRQLPMVEHQAIGQSLLNCGDSVSVQGIVTSSSNVDTTTTTTTTGDDVSPPPSPTADDRLEVVVFEGQRNFIVVFRGTTEQQTKPGPLLKAKNGGGSTSLGIEHGDVQVHKYIKEQYSMLETKCFAVLDRLMDENPFCEICFTGYSFGAALATLAAFRYTNARPTVRASCLTFGSPRIGLASFKQAVHSSPNLKVVRIELGQDGKCQLPNLNDGYCAVGHTLVLRDSLIGSSKEKSSSSTISPTSSSANIPAVAATTTTTTSPPPPAATTTTTNLEKTIKAYKFDVPKIKTFKTIHPDLKQYLGALQEVNRLQVPWVTEFVGMKGQGVVINNESRLVV